MTPARSLVGIDATRAADRVRQQKRNQDDWPYVHLFPPPNSIPVNQTASVVVPAMGSTVTVLTYSVPDGMRLILRGILQAYSGGAFNPGDGLWTVTQNAPASISDTQGAPVQGLISVPIPYGAWQYGKYWRFERPYEFDQETVVRSTFKNVNLGAGAPNWLVSGFMGYLIPVLDAR